MNAPSRVTTSFSVEDGELAVSEVIDGATLATISFAVLVIAPASLTVAETVYWPVVNPCGPFCG